MAHEVKVILHRPALLLVVPLALLACSSTPADVRAWDDEVTGVTAQVNDVLALDFLAALFGVTPAELRSAPRSTSDAKPDLGRIEAACMRLATTSKLYGPLAADAPASRRANPDTFLDDNKDLSKMFAATGELTAKIGDELYDGTDCPERLRATVRTCRESDPAG